MPTANQQAFNRAFDDALILVPEVATRLPQEMAKTVWEMDVASISEEIAIAFLFFPHQGAPALLTLKARVRLRSLPAHVVAGLPARIDRERAALTIERVASGKVSIVSLGDRGTVDAVLRIVVREWELRRSRN